MRTRLVTLLTCFCTPLLLLAALVRFAAPSPAAAQTQPHDNFDSILTTELQAALAEQPDGESIRFIIHFHGDSNLQSFSNKPEAERAAAIVHQLQTSANQTQGRTLAALNQLQDAQSIESYQQLWIINAVSVIGQPEAIERLASDPAIEKIDVDFEIQSLNDETAPIGIEEFAVTTQPVTQTLNNWGIEHIRAAHVWHGLDIDGAGVVIGILDTGIDYSHPDLRPNYRGNLGNGTFDHSTSWHHVVNPSVITEPVDLFGHGTHVAGIAVGQNGIGIAPGAEWIGVGIFEDGGALFDSNAIAGLQWMIAPNGDANSAPDIINCSWGDDRGDRDTLVEAMDAIRQAGIIPICAAGNAGPDGGTIGSPASFASTFAVGAHDDANYVAWFSARGPSPFFDAPHPHIVAPGTAVLSTFPNDIYAIASGTSMAAPHTSGAAALFLTQQPNIATDDLFELLTETAVPISDTHPNMSSGWGRLDAYNLVTQAADFGTLRGQITDDSGPLANIEIQIETPAGYTLDFVTDATGSYEANLASGNYIITVDLFGYEPISLSSVAVNLNQTTNQNISLTHPPSNIIQGQIRSSERNNPLEHVVITVEGVDSPLATTDANGNYQLSLPHGQYKLAYTLLGYEINRQTIVVQAGPTQQLDFSLDSKTTVLLVDSGQWHYDSKISFYETVLDDLNHPADVHAIRDPFHDIPSAEQLAQYDTVIWSDPIYSPGSIGASSAITEYLESGGNLVVSGQNVAAFDSSIFAVPWWQLYMKANFLGQRVITQPIAGAIDTPFSGFSLGVNGTGSARNQFALDGVQGQQGTFAEPLFYYADGDPAAIGVGQCEDYEIAMLGFGLEGISFSFTRA
ncbi:MAG: S8 family serine peptidase, partial [Chloroflexota bacterium]